MSASLSNEGEIEALGVWVASVALELLLLFINDLIANVACVISLDGRTLKVESAREVQQNLTS